MWDKSPLTWESGQSLIFGSMGYIYDNEVGI